MAGKSVHAQYALVYDRDAYRARNAIERMFSRLKDWRRIATRYDKLKTTYTAAKHIAASVMFWLWVPSLGRFDFQLKHQCFSEIKGFNATGDAGFFRERSQ